ncbi:sugar-binding transcriptional regulator [Limosilactobacillus pontis]|uniref:Sugar-binding transcriptional regulator n=1 Tax=Limosilactobacillus pontis TaxID=35787 RepID=A0ABT7UX45_9LACO|nr:sugar-binding transcriptional regulator [Limosilactobacillus pontis]MDM8266122.1 sugar-binding transcriptional regulator [Limosilactobacillus pontis]HJA74543.1 sugar-binding transcriptional regulator [Candidatus Limosilactobacillus gallistercoris]
MDTKHQIKQAVTISRLYYLEGATQAQIAKQLNLSRPTISRALQYARDNNIVNIQVNDPLSNVDDLRAQLQRKYQLDDVVIADVGPTGNYQEDLDLLGQAAAAYLPQIIQDNDTIGISWGRTLAAVARHLQPSDRKNVQVVYLKGTVANSTHNNFVVEVTKHFNACYHTQAEILPLPVIFDNQDIKKMVVKDRFIHSILTAAQQAQVALFTVGTTAPDATLFELGYLNKKEIAKLQKESVGDIVSQFVDADGQIVDPALTARTVALPIDQLKEKRQAVLVAGGMAKLPAIRAALAGRYANVLVTDTNVALHLIDE